MIFFRSIKKNFMLISIMYGIIGYFLIVQKEESEELALIVLAIGMAAAGLFAIIRYFLLKMEERYKRNDFAIGVLIMAFGVMVYFIKYRLFGSVSFIFGVAMIVCGLFSIQDALDAKVVGVSSAGVYILLMIIEAGFGVVSILQPFKTADIQFVVMGIGMLICGIGSLASNIFLAFYRSRYESLNRKLAEREANNRVITPEPVPAEVKIEEPKLKFDVIDTEDNVVDDPEEEKPLE